MNLYDSVFYGFTDKHVEYKVTGQGITISDKILKCAYSAKAIDIAKGKPIPKVEKLGNAGMYLQGCAEFLIHAGDSVHEIPHFNLKVGKITAESSKASPTFCYCFQNETYLELQKDGIDEEGWPISTIILRGVTKQNTLEYLDKAVFKLGFSKQWSLDGERIVSWPEIGCGELDPLRREGNHLILNHKKEDYKHYEPMNFVNGAMRSKTNEERFLLLYRALEFFTPFALVEEINNLASKKIKQQELYQRARKIINKHDEAHLERLLESIKTDAILLTAKNDGIIPEATNNQLVKLIYSRRNSIAHGRTFSGELCLIPSYCDSGNLSPECIVLAEIIFKCIEKWSL